MRIDVTDELATIGRAWAAVGQPASWDGYIQGACDALSLVSGEPAGQLEAQLRAGATPSVAGPRLATVQSPVADAIPVGPPRALPETNVDQGLGFFALDPNGGGMPVERFAEPLKEADLTQPPAGPVPGSMAERFEAALEDGDPALMPLDDDTYAEVMSEIRSGAAKGPWQPPPDAG